MTQNPFENLGGGGFDMNALLQQAQQMQEQIEQAQASLAEQRVEGTSGGVTVTLSGTGDLADVQIPANTFDGSSAEDLSDLADLIVAAARDAKAKADELASTTLGPLAGGLGMGG